MDPLGVLRCILCIQASQALDLAGSQGHLMEDIDVQLSPPLAVIEAIDDLSQGEVLVCSCFLGIFDLYLCFIEFLVNIGFFLVFLFIDLLFL